MNLHTSYLLERACLTGKFYLAQALRWKTLEALAIL